MVTIAYLIAKARELGVFAFVLPFLLAFAVIYAILRKAKLWGDRKNIDLIVSLIVAALVVGYTPFGYAMSTWMINVLGSSFTVAISVLGMILVAYMLLPLLGIARTEKEYSKKLIAFVILISIVIGIGILFAYVPITPGIALPTVGAPAMPTPVIPGIPLTWEDWTVIAIVVGLFIVIWYLAREK